MKFCELSPKFRQGGAGAPGTEGADRSYLGVYWLVVVDFDAEIGAH